jgi:uncharacterized membrane protein YcgQ (UPF0703/DUF1980 family)
MDTNKSARNSLIIAVAIMAVTATLFAINYTKTKKSMENFYSVLGKDEAVDFSQVIQVILNDNQFGTTDEYIRYAVLATNETVDEYNRVTVQASTRPVIEIREKMFMAHVSDVYLNTSDYLGRTIKLEGVFKSQQYYSGENSSYFVVRYGPGDGCCGAGEFGFEVKWSMSRQYPADNSWVEAIGVLKVEQGGYYHSLYLELTSLTVLNKRGSEYVRQ